ncbi:small, acid-soluble spore protein H [Clostridium homopropionicum DSM 5847]|uniref:Small, acid-soluble spore protein H n=1 Tax=Clostridium homopropionicum DSM 5847 TaxID=1121318 RepID=A0A0L6ZA61_9CLOT|nr:H-type small acid-soluble spore protein [Clostridium homopropionicum]KOA19673.1 small, acid-soluble spore protein H [Clostridium homopropionicum DSM 5847]SFF80377.1 small acid-soluble spore protein H (minor) [Clostridium homopropionicum]
MDKNRACEIIESLGVIEVKYKGDPVWLGNIDRNSDIIKVKNLETNQEFNVDIKDLQEG